MSSPTAPPKSQSLWSSGAFRSYLGSTGLSGMATAIQYLLLSWMLVGVLELPADTVGIIQGMIGIPAIILMLWGGAVADRSDARDLLIRVYLGASLVPIGLFIVDELNAVSVVSVAIWGLAMSVATSLSQPAQQAVLNRVSGRDVQRGVSLATAAGFLVQILGTALAGQLDRFGLGVVLIVQALSFLTAGFAIARIPKMAQSTAVGQTNALASIGEGLKATYANKDILHVLLINFVSSVFNAAAFMTVVPFIVTRVYAGDAQILSITIGVFYTGAMLSNVLIYRIMPFQRPGRMFLLMQLSRPTILSILWMQPSFVFAVLVVLTWGMNMGFTTTLARTVVQESAAPAFRGRILSVFTLGMIGSAPIGAVVLGTVVENFGALNGLVPAMITSAVLFTLGVTITGLWRYRSPEFEEDPPHA